MKKILGYLLLFIHAISLPIAIILIIFLKNFIIDYLILLYFTIIIIGWILFGNCFLTPIENYLLNKKEFYNDNTERSRITILLEDTLKINKNIIFYFFTFLPIIVIFVIIIKIYYYIKKNK
jgi:hypothetical protein